MSWASRRRSTYLTGIGLFFFLVVGGPIAWWYFSIPATCFDGIQNQGETATDKGGPCLALDERALQPYAILWSRSFKVRDGSYNAVAYVQNPNPEAGIGSVSYHFGLYDSQNVLIAERGGTTFIMPGEVTPVFESRIDTGNRIVAHTYFEFTEPLRWERMRDSSGAAAVSDKAAANAGASPRITASVTNTSVADISDATFVAVVFDPYGNAFAASQSTIPRLSAGETRELVYTWPDPFATTIGRVDITPLVEPVPLVQ